MNSSKSSVTLKDTKISGCRANDDDGGAIYHDTGSLRCENTVFDSNSASDKGGAIYKNTKDQVWFLRCRFTGNTAEHDDGGAIYLDDNYLYLENCSLEGNAAHDKGGAIYLHSTGSVDMGGVMLVQNNDGAGTFDNLVLEKGAAFYDVGLAPGSQVHLRSASNGEVRLSNKKFKMGEYQMKNYLVSDNENGLYLKDVEKVDTKMMASAFSRGKAAMILGGILILFGAAYIILLMRSIPYLLCPWQCID